MEAFTLVRFSTKTENGTYGQIIHNSLPVCVTFELPWRHNAPRISCIPAGIYKAVYTWSPKHGCKLYELQGVIGRGDIQIHKGNHAGHSLGCILPGLSFGMIDETDAQGKLTGKKYLGTWNSSVAFGNFMAETKLAPEIAFEIREVGL